MSYVYFNPNPDGLKVGDCVVRALSKALSKSWDETYIELAVEGLRLSDMPTANRVWANLLSRYGFKKTVINNSCNACYFVLDFCRDHPQGVFVLGTGTHVIAVVNGDYFDTWDSGKEVPLFYWSRE